MSVSRQPKAWSIQSSIRKRSDGRWEGRYTVGYDESGKVKMKNVLGKTQAEVKEKLKEKIEEGGFACLRAGRVAALTCPGMSFTPAPFESTTVFTPNKRDIRMDVSFIWWGKVDSNHRRHCQQIYSLSHLATLEFPRIQLRWSWWTDSNPRPADYKRWPEHQCIDFRCFSQLSCRGFGSI